MSVPPLSQARSTGPDWILTGAVIWPGGGESRRGTSFGPPPVAMAIHGGRVAALGSETEILALRRPGTPVLSLEGRTVVPGFVDAHAHLLVAGLQLGQVDLRGLTSPEAFVRRVSERARTFPPGTWILGGGWQESDWHGPLPQASWLDAAAPGHPVFLQRADLHMGVASSLALVHAGIDARSPDPEGGRIDRDPVSGAPTGILRERAMRAVTGAFPPLSEAERMGALQAAARYGLARGVTQFHDMGTFQGVRGSWRALESLRRLRAEDALPVRVVAGVPIEDWRELAELIAAEGRGDDRLRWGMVKGFVDGSLGSATAWFHEAYTDDPSHCGGPAGDLDALERNLADAVAAGLQPAVHAIGDRANDWLLDAYAGLRRAYPDRDLRLRLEHAQHLTPAAVRLAGAENVIVSAQPLHLVEDGRQAGRRLGPDREPGSFAFAGLEQAGARLAFGSDWPVAQPDPLAAIRAAVTRRLDGGTGTGPESDREGWLPGERLALASAMRAHTHGGAVAGFMEGESGQLAHGMQADFAVLTGDPFAAEPEGLGSELRVEMTFVAGRLVHPEGRS